MRLPKFLFTFKLVPCYTDCTIEKGLFFMKKAILRTKPIHLIVFSAIGVFLLIFVLFIPTIFKWGEDDLVRKILWYVISVAGIIFFFYQLLANLEFAVIQNNTFVIKKYLFIKIVEIPLEKLQYVFVERLSAQSNPASPSVNWITLCLDKKEKIHERKHGGINRKNKSPWQIIATRKNIEVLSRYVNIDDPWNLLCE